MRAPSPKADPGAARALWEFVAWLGDMLRRIGQGLRREDDHSFLKTNLHALERACDPETNPRLRSTLAALGILAPPGTTTTGEVKSWTLRRVPRSANKLLRMHWGRRRREEKDWRLLIRSVCGRPQTRVEGRVHLRVTVHRIRCQDLDNAYASLKPVLDALVREGWLRDDSPEWLELELEEILEVDRGRQRTELVWRDASTRSCARSTT